MSLINLTNQKKLPAHQYMDRETLRWVVKNKPAFGSQIHYKPNVSTPKYLREYIPPKDWFLSPEFLKNK